MWQKVPPSPLLLMLSPSIPLGFSQVLPVNLSGPILGGKNSSRSGAG